MLLLFDACMLYYAFLFVMIYFCLFLFVNHLLLYDFNNVRLIYFNVADAHFYILRSKYIDLKVNYQLSLSVYTFMRFVIEITTTKRSRKQQGRRTRVLNILSSLFQTFVCSLPIANLICFEFIISEFIELSSFFLLFFILDRNGLVPFLPCAL